MNVSVVIPTRNRALDLARCLAALSDQSAELCEVLVIDNGSTDATSTVISRYGVKSIRDSSRNLSKLFNLGWRSAIGDVVAFLNDDAEPQPGWARSIKSALLEYPNAAMVGGPTIDQNPRQIENLLARANESAPVRLLVKMYDRIVTKGRLMEVGQIFDTGGYSIGGYHEAASQVRQAFWVDQLTVTNVAIRREALELLGGFDEGFQFMHSDGDLFIRARKLGQLLLFHPKVMALHYANPGGLTRNPRVIGVDTARFMLRSVHPHTLRDILGWLANVFAFMFYWIYRTIETSQGHHLQGVLGFWIGVSRVVAEG